MSVDELIAELRGAGVRLWEESGQLRFRGPKGAMTPRRKEALKAEKQAVLDSLRLASEIPRAQPDPVNRHEPFPLTDVQSAYLVGRHSAFDYGGVACHGYVEVAFPDLDPVRLQDAWRALIRRHDALRTIVLLDGHQRVLPEVPEYVVAVADLRDADPGEDRQAIMATRELMAHQVHQPDQWPLFELRIIRTEDHAVLHLSIDLLIADYASIQLLLAELNQLYLEPGRELGPLDITFRDYVLAERALRSSARHEADREYWLARVDDLPAAPELPVAARSGDRKVRFRFRRWETTLPARRWTALREHATEHGTTASGAVLACYAEVIGRWSRRDRFTLNLTLLNRLPLHPHTDDLVGDFTSVSLLAVDRGGEDTFAGRARELTRRLFTDMDHRSFSGVEVVRELARRRGRGAALMPVVFTSAIGLADDRVDHGELMGGAEFVYGISQTPQVWIDCQVMERKGDLVVNWDVRDGVLPDTVVADMFAAFTGLLDRLADEPEVWSAGEVVDLPPAQRERRRRVCDTAGPLPDGLLQDAVLAQAARTPERTAVRFRGRGFTYRELVERAEMVAADLAARGCARGDLVAVHMDKGPEQVVAVLGVLLAGAAYLPIDTNQPVVRRDGICADAGVRLVLTQPWLSGSDWPADLGVLVVDAAAPVRAVPEPVRPAATGPDDLAYVIYTSGSTGRPKGVMISHRAALNTVVDINRRFKIGQDDRVLGLAHLGFDLSVYDIFGPLAVGGCLVLPDPARRGDPSHWAEVVAGEQVTVWNSVPAQLQMLSHFLAAEPEIGLPSLRLAILSGDWIPVSLPDEIRGRLSGLELISLGGATEAAIWSIFHPIGLLAPDAVSVPYGKPLTNQTFHVFDPQLLDCPEWTVGELYIGGAGVAMGYLGDEELTARRFVTHPRTGLRLYRTGDLGRYLPDGDIEFLGREDQQVKVRGHRIELGEVEAALSACPGVSSAAVIAHGDRVDDRRLIGFVAPARLDDESAARGRAGLDEPVAAGRRAAQRAADGIDRDLVREFVARLDRVALSTMAHALRGAGLFADTDHSQADVVAALSVSPGNHRLVRRWLRALRDNGMLDRDTETGRLRGLCQVDESDLADAWSAVETLQAQVDFGADLVRYLRVSAENLPGLLSGAIDPLHLLFPEGATRNAEAAYRDNLIAGYLNDVADGVLGAVAGRAPAEEPLRVLEIGGGVGGTTAGLLGALDGHPVDYLFTDVSPFFLDHARERFADRPWVRYGRFDLNEDFRPQGMAANTFDVVVAANVLHYAHDIDAGLARVVELLRPGGLLVFIDATRENYPLMTSVEFLEGGAGFEDARQAGEAMFLTGEQWRRALADVGAELVLCLPEDGDPVDSLGQHVFVARVKPDRAPVSVAELSAELALRLPEYMFPSAIQVVDRIPLSDNGKIDRRRLAELMPNDGDAPSARVGEPPRTDLERRLAVLWAEVLKVPEVSREDDFFELGGDSLVAARLVGLMRERVPEAGGMFFDSLVRELLPNPTVAAVAAHLERRAPVEAVSEAMAPSALDVLGSALEATGDWVVPVLVHDAAGTMDAYGALPDLLAEYGPVVRLRVPEQAGYLNRDPAGLVEAVATDYVRALAAEGFARVRVVGIGVASALAAELAGQLAEARVRVDQLLVVDGVEPDDSAVSRHTEAATARHDGIPYTGDLTLVTTERATSPSVAEWERWCLGEVTVVPVADRSAAIGAAGVLLTARST